MVGYPYQYGDTLTEDQANHECQKFVFGFATATFIGSIYKFIRPNPVYAVDKNITVNSTAVALLSTSAPESPVALEKLRSIEPDPCFLALSYGISVRNAAFWIGFGFGTMILIYIKPSYFVRYFKKVELV